VGVNRVTFRCSHGARVAVVTVEVAAEPREALVQEVAGLFEPFQVSGSDPGGDTAPIRVTGAGDEGFRLHTSGGVQDLHSRPDLLSALEFLLLERLLAPTRDEAHLHASGAVSPHGTGVLCLGPSGSGKSTLALELAHRGLALLGDDLVMVENGCTVRGFPRLLKIHRERLAERDLSPGETLAHDPGEPEVWWAPGRQAGWALDPVTVGIVSVVRFRPGARLEVRHLGPAEILRNLLDNTLDSGLPPARALDRYAALAEDAPGVELTFGDARVAVDTLLRLAEENPGRGA
jgi:hypothetical protein